MITAPVLLPDRRRPPRRRRQLLRRRRAAVQRRHDRQLPQAHGPAMMCRQCPASETPRREQPPILGRAPYCLRRGRAWQEREQGYCRRRPRTRRRRRRGPARGRVRGQQQPGRVRGRQHPQGLGRPTMLRTGCRVRCPRRRRPRCPRPSRRRRPRCPRPPRRWPGGGG